jgi:hypothetical protein
MTSVIVPQVPSPLDASAVKQDVQSVLPAVPVEEQTEPSVVEPKLHTGPLHTKQKPVLTFDAGRRQDQKFYSFNSEGHDLKDTLHAPEGYFVLSQELKAGVGCGKCEGCMGPGCKRLHETFWCWCCRTGKPCKKQCTTTTRKFTAFPHHMTFWWWFPRVDYRKRCFFEIIGAFQAQKPYFDIDLYGMTLEQAEARRDAVMAAIPEVHKEIRTDGILPFESHGGGKHSFHIIVFGWRFPDCSNNAEFAKKVFAKLPEDMKYFTYTDKGVVKTKPVIDAGVYSSKQPLRMYQNHKFGSDRVKTLPRSWWPTEVEALPEAEQDGAIFQLSLVTYTSETQPMPHQQVDVKVKYTGPKGMVSAEQAARVEEMRPDGYKTGKWNGTLLPLVRTGPSMCLVCERVHNHENAYFTVHPDYITLHCRRDRDKWFTISLAIGPIEREAKHRQEPHIQGLPMPYLPGATPGLVGIDAGVSRFLKTPEEIKATAAASLDAPLMGSGPQVTPLPAAVNVWHQVEPDGGDADDDGVTPLPTEGSTFGVPTWPGEEIKWDAGNRFDNTRLMLTYPTRADKKQTEAAIRGIIPTPVWLRLANMMFEGKPVTNILFDLGQVRFRKSHASISGDGQPLVMMRSFKNKKQFTDAKAFLSADPDNSDLTPPPVTAGPSTETIMAAVERGDMDAKALYKKFLTKDCTNYTQLKAICTDMLRKKRYDPLAGKTLLPWQLMFKRFTQTKADDESIVWIQEPKGGCGKTMLARHLYATGGTDVYMVNDLGTFKDSASIVKSAIDGGWTGVLMIVNLGRAAEDYKIYNALEAIKDGIITATKYMGGTMDWEPGHVVVFANWLPNAEQLSFRRWLIFALKPTHQTNAEGYPVPFNSTLERMTSLQLHGMTPNEAIKARIKQKESRLEGCLKNAAHDLGDRRAVLPQ